MGNCNDNDTIIVNAKNYLKRKLDDTTGLVPIVNAEEPFGIVHDWRNRYINCHQKVASSSRTSFGVPFGGIGKFNCRIRVKINLHRGQRFVQTTGRESLTSFQFRQFQCQSHCCGGRSQQATQVKDVVDGRREPTRPSRRSVEDGRRSAVA
ncbi:hypothetical protein RISK_006559 [Rhodopirellula islandica]|uniref:Uncharacterized protein n=1 Tax=Rhodopirellula islandica TaxID=595434 RepID=A0A0J1B482_RHOIS|nr:hypothetical protein RISK_006559 [Rhodopirellula islandica]